LILTSTPPRRPSVRFPFIDRSFLVVRRGPGYGACRLHGACALHASVEHTPRSVRARITRRRMRDRSRLVVVRVLCRSLANMR
jgi:hypothetical protein